MKMFSRSRSAMLASAAVLTLPAGVAAQAAPDRPVASVELPHSGAAAGTAVGSGGGSVETPHITINNNFTPTQAQDPTNITGVGQIVTDAGGGFIGTCTGTLINRRTVIFAAHCVNNSAATSYGANTGGTAIGVGFEQNTRANAAGQTDELVQWLLAGPNQYRTNLAQSFYNIRQVF